MLPHRLENVVKLNDEVDPRLVNEDSELTRLRNGLHEDVIRVQIPRREVCPQATDTKRQREARLADLVERAMDRSHAIIEHEVEIGDGEVWGDADPNLADGIPIEFGFEEWGLSPGHQIDQRFGSLQATANLGTVSRDEETGEGTIQYSE
jgi:hypothetical protein